MTTHCRSCGAKFDGRFCPACGTSAAVPAAQVAPVASAKVRIVGPSPRTVLVAALAVAVMAASWFGLEFFRFYTLWQKEAAIPRAQASMLETLAAYRPGGFVGACDDCWVAPIPSVAITGSYLTPQAVSWAAADRLSEGLIPMAGRDEKPSKWSGFPQGAGTGAFVSDNNFLRLAEYLAAHPEISGRQGALVGVAYAGGFGHFFVFLDGRQAWSSFERGPLASASFSAAVTDNSGPCVKWQLQERDWSLLSKKLTCVKRATAKGTLSFAVLSAPGKIALLADSAGFPVEGATVSTFGKALELRLVRGETQSVTTFPYGLAKAFALTGSTPQAAYADLAEMSLRGVSSRTVTRAYEQVHHALAFDAFRDQSAPPVGRTAKELADWFMGRSGESKEKAMKFGLPFPIRVSVDASSKPTTVAAQLR